MYAEWAARLAPGLPFPLVLDQLEALGKTASLKVEMRELREGALSGLDLASVEEARRLDGWLGGGAGGGATLAPAEVGAAPAAEEDEDALLELAFDDDDEGDELLALQAAG